MNKIWRSCTALLMALCLMLGVCSTGFVAGAADESTAVVEFLQMLENGTIDVKRIDGEKVEELIEEGAIEVNDKTKLIALVEKFNEGDLTLENLFAEIQREQINIEVKDTEAVMDAVNNGAVEFEANFDLNQIINDLMASDKLDMAVNVTMEYGHELTAKVVEILKKLDPTVEELGHKLEGLHEELAKKLHELDNELAPHLAEQEKILNNMIAERAALIEKLESLNEKLIAVKNGSFLRTVPTTDALDAAIAELEADIAATEAEIAELDAAIAWAYEQITADKSGIEAIKAAIVEIKDSIIATEAALAEVNAAIDQLVADLAVLNDAMVVLVEAADALANKTGVDLDVEEVIAAVITIAENIPAILESIEDTYYKVVEIAEKIEATVAEIKATVESIKAIAESLIEGAENIGNIAVEEVKLIQATIEEMAWMIHEFGAANLWGFIDDAMPVVHELKDLAHGEAKKAYELWLENKDTVYGALVAGYAYCVSQGYVEQAKQLIADVLDVTDEEIECIKTHLGYVEAIVLEQLDAAEKILTAKLTELEIKYFGAEGGLKAQIKAQIETVKKQLDDVKAVIETVKNDFAELRAAVKAVEEALAEVTAAIKVVANDTKALVEAVKNLDAAIVRMNAAVEALHDAVVNEVNRVLGYAGVAAGELIDVIETLDDYVALLRHIPAILKEAVIHATNDHFLVSQDSHYVALGDANAYGAAADLLAAHLSKYLGAKIGYENATVAGQTAAELVELLPELEETLAKADLVTIGFSANTFTQFVVDQLTGVMMGTEVAELDWEALVGAEGAAYVAEAMEELKAELEANGAGEMMGIDVADLLALAIESYAYAYVEFVINYVQVVDGVHAINPDAQVVLVGMHNPMAGVILDMEGTEIALGDYLEYIIEVSNAYAFGYAFIVPETIFVNAPAVETATEAGTVNAVQFLMALLTTGTDNFVPTEAGHAYIEEQIWNALNVYKQGMLGDVDSNGVVNHIDAMLVLQYYTEVVGADDLDLGVADVDGNGVINHVDSMLILQYYTEVIEVFPAA